jgi:hypothetical protein
MFNIAVNTVIILPRHLCWIAGESICKPHHLVLDTQNSGAYRGNARVPWARPSAPRRNIPSAREYYTGGRGRFGESMLKTRLKEWKTPFETVWKEYFRRTFYTFCDA